MSTGSVPTILLGLGALCLLIAAVVFLAVTWSVIGVPGRTAILLAFTVVAFALGAVAARRNLRGAAESLTLVGLGLLCLDILGARSAGWFGAPSTSAFLLLLGMIVAAVAGIAAVVVRRTPVRELVGADSVATAGLAIAAFGIAITDWLSTSAALIAAVAFAVSTAGAAHRARLHVTAPGTVCLASAAWAALAINSLSRAVDHLDLRALWPGLEAWPLLVAIGMAAAVAVMGSWPIAARVAALGLSEALLAVLLVLPAMDNTVTTSTLAVVAVMGLTMVLVWLLPRPWSFSLVLTQGIGAVGLLTVATVLFSHVLERVERSASPLWSGNIAGRFPAVATYDDPVPWLLPVALVTLAGMAIVWRRRPTPAPVLGSFAAASITASVILYPVPVWAVVALLAASASALVARALFRRTPSTHALAIPFLIGAVMVGGHSRGLTVVAFAIWTALSALVHLRSPRILIAEVSGVLFALASAGLAGSICAVAQVSTPWAMLVILGVMAVLVLAGSLLPNTLWACDASDVRTGSDVGAASVALVASAAGVLAAHGDAMASWAAVYLTVAGATVFTLSMVRADRRQLTWLGGGLLALASWVRLWNIGVGTPEAYTLPSAVVLVLVGLLHLRRRPGADTMRALGPGLSLALVPSLLWSLAEPATLRSALLGLACAAILAAGVRLRWTAPLVVAAIVGSVLVIRLAAPFIGIAVPRWVLIGAAGAVLVSAGVTWERRVRDARLVAGYVQALR